MSISPLVTVIIPTYNRAQWVGRAIESVLAQEFTNYELIVVDDGSTDHTAQVVAAYPSVQYVYKKNGRQASARNAGLALSRGTYIATLDSDDTWNPDFLACTVAKIEADALDFVFCNWVGYNLRGQELHELETKQGLQNYFYGPTFAQQPWIEMPYNELRRFFLNGCLAPSSAMLFRKSSLVKPWNEHMMVADDWEFLIGIIVSKPVRVAFYKPKLWTKYQVGDNLFDGLEYTKMVDLVMLRDLNLILKIHEQSYTLAERKRIAQTQSSYCFWSAYYQIKRLNLYRALQMLHLSHQIDPHLTQKRLWKLSNFSFAFRALGRAFKRLSAKL